VVLAANKFYTLVNDELSVINIIVLLNKAFMKYVTTAQKFPIFYVLEHW